MDKVIKDLVELSSEGKKDMLITRNRKGNITLNYVSDSQLINKEDIIGAINLEVYNTYEDIKEEIESMLDN